MFTLYGMTFQVPIKDIPSFEAQNPDISVTVITMDKYRTQINYQHVKQEK